jgi:hypothetical protein
MTTFDTLTLLDCVDFFVFQLSEYVEYISSRQAEMNEWLLCFFHILKMSSKHLLRTWLRREIPAKIFLFLRLISLALFILQVSYPYHSYFNDSDVLTIS